MVTFSSELLSKINLSCNIMDITACLFIMLLLITAAVQKWNMNIQHFLSGLILLINGISCYVLVRALEFAHKTYGDPAVILDGSPGSADTFIRIIGFVFIFLSITQFFLQALSVKEPFEKRCPGKHHGAVLRTLIIAAGIEIYLVTDREEVLTAIIMAHLIVGLYSTLKNEAFVFRRTPVIISVIISALACVLAIVVPEMKYTGLALTIMYVILYIEFHTYIEAQLSISEAELAESHIRLMNEQISSHFTFNTLKVIEDLCRTDPIKAGQMINGFSKYLRSNLENITVAGMIPFEDELEHTMLYIGLEQLEGSASFDVRYDIRVTDFKVPPLVLEPLAENAIKHGVKRCGADTVTISTYVKDGRVMISVSDNGNVSKRIEPGIGSRRRSIAIENIRSRLALQCEGALDVVYSEHGAAATISIPCTDTGIYKKTKA